MVSYREVVILWVVLITTGCVAVRTTSEAGKRTCLRQVAAEMPLNSPQEKQDAYRECLRGIDERLTKAALLEKELQEKAQSEKLLAEQLKQATWASQEERWSFCKSNQKTIAELDRRHTRAYAKLLAANNRSSQSITEKAGLEIELNSIKAEISTAIPERMRAGQTLIPDSLLIFKHCNPVNFKSIK